MLGHQFYLVLFLQSFSAWFNNRNYIFATFSEISDAWIAYESIRSKYLWVRLVYFGNNLCFVSYLISIYLTSTTIVYTDQFKFRTVIEEEPRELREGILIWKWDHGACLIYGRFRSLCGLGWVAFVSVTAKDARTISNCLTTECDAENIDICHQGGIKWW